MFPFLYLTYNKKRLFVTENKLISEYINTYLEMCVWLVWVC